VKFFQDDTITLHHGKALDVARSLPDGCADCIVTSPPYFGLRDYGEEGQYGLEETPGQYVEAMRLLFSELRRVLADDGTLWLNVGDTYGRGARSVSQPPQTFESGKRRTETVRPQDDSRSLHLPPKSLIGIPWRLAFALQDDGWILRNSIIWHKPNAMPESVTDRLSGKHENIFMFTKSQRYWFDLDPIRERIPEQQRNEQAAMIDALEHQQQQATRGKGQWAKNANNLPGVSPQRDKPGTHANGRNPGDVWAINTRPFGGAHFAVFPEQLPARCIQAGCKPGGTVLDPFNGSGTTGAVAERLGRKYIGIDISQSYLKLTMETRLQQPAAFDFGELA
jgi:DNA modification methylase